MIQAALQMQPSHKLESLRSAVGGLQQGVKNETAMSSSRLACDLGSAAVVASAFQAQGKAQYCWSQTHVVQLSSTGPRRARILASI